MANAVADHDGQDRFLPLGIESNSETEQPAENYRAREAGPMMGMKIAEAHGDFAIEANITLIQGTDPPVLEEASPEEEDPAIESMHRPLGESRCENAVLEDDTPVMPEKSGRDDQTRIIDPVHKDGVVCVGPEIAA